MNRKQRRATGKAGGIADVEMARLCDEAIRFLQAGALDLAAEKFRKVIEIDPSIPQIHNNLGAVLKEQGRWEEAIISYRNALRIDPSWKSALNNLSSCLVITEQFAEAETVARRALALQPGNTTAMANLGMALQELGRWEEAIVLCRKGIARDPKVITFYTCLSRALLSANPRCNRAVLSGRAKTWLTAPSCYMANRDMATSSSFCAMCLCSPAEVPAWWWRCNGDCSVWPRLCRMSPKRWPSTLPFRPTICICR